MNKWLPPVLAIGLFAPALSRDIVYGMNLDVVSTDIGLITNCAADPNATVPKQAFIARYASKSVQSATRAQLKELRSSGFRVIRSIVQLYPGEHPSGDLTDIYRIDSAAIRNYVRDVRDAGFDSLIIAFGAQGAANPGCRNKQWGDCFDPKTVSYSVKAEEQVIRAARTISGISLRIDLLNEACVSSRVPPLLNANFATFVKAASKKHSVAFREVPATVSCQLERAIDGLAATMRIMAENGDHMSFVDVHAYPEEAGSESETLSKAAESVRATKLPFIFGETSYGDPTYRHLLVNAFQAAFNASPQEVLFWPVHSLADHCHFDVVQPYTLDAALGG